MPSRLVFTGKHQVACVAHEVPAPGPGQVRVRALCSLISTGTEGIVFDRLFDSGGHYDRWVQYPFHPGYSLIAEVEAVGEGVTARKPGDRVALRQSHVSHHVCNAGDCIPVPAGLDPRLAAWFALAKITFMGAKAAALPLGDDVLVVGAGPIGQMVLRWVHAAGVRNLAVIDPIASRLELARRGGATATIAKPLGEAGPELDAAFAGRRPRVVIDSTGHPRVFAAALAAVRDHGKVVVLGDTGTPSSQTLTSDIVLRGVQVVGAHDGHNDAAWNDQTISALFFQMLADGRFNLDGMQSHSFDPRDCVQAYELISTRRAETMGVVFEWMDRTLAASAAA